MNLAHVAAVLLTVSNPGAGETVLLDFGADWCGYCRQMDPIVDGLAREGYPVRKVNVDENRALALRYSANALPCFVLLVDGQEVDRLEGKTDRAKIEAMFRRNGVAPKSVTARGQSPENMPPTTRPVPFPPSERAAGRAMGGRPAPAPDFDKLIRASVRLKIEDTHGNSSGSGTIIDAREGEALIVTCGHVFRDAAKDGKILVDLFGPNAPRGLEGRLIAYDIKSEVGIISIETDYPVGVARLAPPELKLKPGDQLVSVGCDGGADATARQTKVKSINRYLGAPNLQVDFEPVQGRSGGGLFTPDGWMVGICYAADPASKEGLFTALPAIRDELDRAGLAFVYRQVAEQARPANAARAMNEPGEFPSNRSLALNDLPSGAQLQGSGEAALSSDEQAALKMLREKAAHAEVVCIVRPMNNPQAKSEIIVLDRVSPAFIDRLKSERAEPPAPQLTSLETPSTESAHGRNVDPAAGSGRAPAAGQPPRSAVERSPWYAGR